jgi:hypothetical protein
VVAEVWSQAHGKVKVKEQVVGVKASLEHLPFNHYQCLLLGTNY